MKRMGVIGAGQMGSGIAQVAARSGVDVIVLDLDRTLAEGAVERIGTMLGKLADKGKISAQERDQARGRLRAEAEYSHLHDCDIVVEAAPEDQALKRAIFAELDRATSPEAILASNTSSISITQIAAATSRPEQVIGMHFMNPVPLMNLVEIVRGLATSDATYRATCALAERMGKVAITSRDVPGFIVNRVLIPLITEACFALYEGLGTAEDIDTGC